MTRVANVVCSMYSSKTEKSLTSSVLLGPPGTVYMTDAHVSRVLRVLWHWI
jgi:hypothetical protein